MEFLVEVEDIGYCKMVKATHGEETIVFGLSQINCECPLEWKPVRFDGLSVGKEQLIEHFRLPD